MATQRRDQLLIIDPQNDFCDIPGAALPVAGANADMARLATLVAGHGDRFAGITVTLDSHHTYDIAHASYWRDAAGNKPSPFTAITSADVASGAYRPADSAQAEAVAQYLGRSGLFLWPDHCIVGSWGHGVHDVLAAALSGWEAARLANVDYLFKGLNPRTEHFSAFEADVPVDADPDTQFNPARVRSLAAADRVLVAGEALSHCVASSVRSLLRHLGREFAQRMVLLGDAMSPVPGFEAQGQAFIDEFVGAGGKIATTQNLFA
ncbi:isochorismatase family protein [Cupriavidus sp. D39]|uniref:isochorismatase family protein n=1 Tax=Cupriavidus sp. D39 TaxID=2997877 RepID=UPI00226FEE19|nr:isochorismatase family protein [Cupriavidus sp. D39]MCY0855556.1 isochorismatase family protein [Cupriavidus sp. D39]